MAKESVEEYERQVQKRINETSDVPWNTVNKAIADCDDLLLKRPEKMEQLNEIKGYLKSF